MFRVRDEYPSLFQALQEMCPYTTTLEDGTSGYPSRGTDDCFAAAVATVLQVPIEEVPDPRLDERLAAGDSVEEIDADARANFEAWLDDRELRMVLHRSVPVRQRRWIGVVPLQGVFGDHCLVMTGQRLLFDPSGFEVFTADDVRFGLSFTRSHTGMPAMQPTKRRSRRDGRQH